MQILFLLLLIPLVEIYFFVQVGSVIGGGMTVFLVVFTAVFGIYLVRQQGFATFRKMQTTIQMGEDPAIEMMEGVALFIAGMLLLTPGFATDILGFALLVPLVRRTLIYKFIAKFTRVNSRAEHPHSPKPRIIEGKYKDFE